MIDKVYKIMDDMDNSDLVKKLNVVKKSINEDEIAQNLIKNFNEAKENYDKYGLKEDYLKAKTSMLKNELISEYISIQNNVNLLSLQINNRIKNITKGVTKK